MTSFNKNIDPESEKQFKKCIKDSKNFSTKTQVKQPSILKTLQRNRYQPRSVYYFTFDRNIDNKLLQNEKDTKKSPFDIPKEVDDFSYRTKFREKHVEMREKDKLYKYYNRPTYRSRLNEGKLERLHVSTTDMELPGKSITEDTDPEFFSVVSGRPIKEKFDVMSYLKDLQSLFLIRLQIGYKFDETYLMEEMNIKEKKCLEALHKQYRFYSECYDKFVAEDNSVTLDLLKTSEEETAKSQIKREKVRNLLKDCGFYKTKILILDEKWRIARVYQKFLYQISPLWWRKKFDFLHRNKKTGTIKTSESAVLVKPTTGLNAMPLLSLNAYDIIIDQFINDIKQLEPPQLYFKDPNELLQILHELEKNNLLALLQCEELTQPAQQMVLDLHKAHQLFKREINTLQEHIKFLEEEVIFEESRPLECEQKAKVISFGLFKDLIVDKYALNLYVNVEDCFEACVAPNDSNLTLSMMMKGIEYEQESLMSSLDQLPKEIVLKALQTCYREDARIMKEAYEATKIIVQIENLMKTLRKSLEPKAEGKKGRKLVWRSEPPVEKMEIKTHTSALTKEQLDYLYFFTNFCPTAENQSVGKQLCNQKSVNININL